MTEDALTKGLADILTFNCGRRPVLTERSVMALVLRRFDHDNLSGFPKTTASLARLCHH